jgi:hypothetical protein
MTGVASRADDPTQAPNSHTGYSQEPGSDTGGVETALLSGGVVSRHCHERCVNGAVIQPLRSSAAGRRRQRLGPRPVPSSPPRVPGDAGSSRIIRRWRRAAGVSVIPRRRSGPGGVGPGPFRVQGGVDSARIVEPVM